VSFHQEVSIAGSPPPLAKREITVLITSAVLLVLYYYFGKPSYFTAEIWPGWVESGRADAFDPEYLGLLKYGYWAVAGVVLRILVPCVVIAIVIRENPLDYGLRFSLKHAWVYLLFFIGMLPILYLVSTDPAFQQKYPFYERARDGGDQFMLYELCYGVQFLALESFFRGFMVFGLYKRFGYYALLIMAVPYCLIHFGKPVPETLGAIVAGVALGYMALKSGSIYLGALLHWGIGITMDALSIMQTQTH